MTEALKVSLSSLLKDNRSSSQLSLSAGRVCMEMHVQTITQLQFQQADERKMKNIIKGNSM